MAKIELDSVQSGLSVTTLNSNFQKISEALNTKVLWRDNPDGEANFLQQDLDFNGFAPININVTAFLQNVSEALAELQEQMEGLTEDLVEFRAEVDDALVEINTATDQAQQAVVDSQAQVGLATEQAELAESYAASINPSSFLLKANNLSDLADVDEARANLGITDAPLASYLMMSVDDSVVPPGYLLANGAGVSVTYPELRALYLAQGSPYGVDGDGNPRLPDMGGYFPRGWRSGQLVDSGRVFGTVQGDAIRNITGGLGAFVENPGATGAFKNGESYTGKGGGSWTNWNVTFDASRVVPTADENRPANVTFTFWIKAYPAQVDTGSIDLANLTNDIQGFAAVAADVATSKADIAGLKSSRWRGEPINITGLSSVAFTGIPSDATKAEITLTNITRSVDGVWGMLLGTTSGYETAGYRGTSGIYNPTTMSTLFTLPGTSAPDEFHGTLYLKRVGTTTTQWSISGLLGVSNREVMMGVSGSKALASVLDRIQIATTSGLFKSGYVSFSWEK